MAAMNAANRNLPDATCDTCAACCCRLEVMLIGDDGIPAALAGRSAWGGVVMRRLDDGWCAALDRDTMRCAIYGQRPAICRDFRMAGDDCVAERARWAAGPDSASVPGRL